MQMQTKLTRGRPTIYSKELTDNICTLIAQGNSMRSICERKEMPEMQTIWRWLREYKLFSEQYAKATIDRTESQLEELNNLGDTSIDEAKLADPKSANAIVQAYKLKADNMKWVMSKMKPKKYGDKLELGGDQDNPITIELVSYANKMITAPSKDNTPQLTEGEE
jgi:hypothetical protein